LKHRRFATQQDCEVPLKKTSRKRGTINVRALDMRAMICVSGGLSQGEVKEVHGEGVFASIFTN